MAKKLSKEYEVALRGHPKALKIAETLLSGESLLIINGTPLKNWKGKFVATSLVLGVVDAKMPVVDPKAEEEYGEVLMAMRSPEMTPIFENEQPALRPILAEMVSGYMVEGKIDNDCLPFTNIAIEL